ncbi:UNVERIFIED_CONTAM: hypothetical protein Sradi_6254100 [Sesamum radiatum]|uniref:MENTAL domain-containing protein n=1 Tax=Sesamum radiatum TaxID=300843 RepID=A0AAW2KA69_SESRA
MDQNPVFLDHHVDFSPVILRPYSPRRRRRPSPLRLLVCRLSPSSLNLQTFSSHLSNYDFRYSLIDIPLVSIIRSAIILCVYSFCDGPRLSRGPYLAIATVSAASLVFVSLKASYLIMMSSYSSHSKGGYVRAMEAALFVSSLGLAIGHVVVAYRTSCRERRKLLVYKIDIEAFHPKEIGSLMLNEVGELHKP